MGVTFCVVEFEYFGLCNVLCTEFLWFSAVYLGDLTPPPNLAAPPPPAEQRNVAPLAAASPPLQK